MHRSLLPVGSLTTLACLLLTACGHSLPLSEVAHSAMAQGMAVRDVAPSALPLVAPAIPQATPPGRHFSSIIWCVMENHNSSQAKSLASEQLLMAKGATFANYHAVTHPSGPNYRVMGAGQYWTHAEIFDQPEPTVATELTAVGLPTIEWYMAGTPALRHDPYVELHSQVTIRRDAFQPDALPPAAQVYLGYDDDDDAHSGPMSVVDDHLKTLVTALDNSKWFNTPDANGKYPVLMVTWDEGYPIWLPNRVLTTFYGHGVKPGYVSQAAADHYGICRTMTDNWGLAPLADAAKAHAFDDIWK